MEFDISDLIKSKCINWRVKILQVKFNSRLNSAIKECQNNETCIISSLIKDSKDNLRNYVVYINKDFKENYANLPYNIQIFDTDEQEKIKPFIVNYLQKIISYENFDKHRSFIEQICAIKQKINSILTSQCLDFPLNYRVPNKLITEFSEFWENQLKQIETHILISNFVNYEKLISDQNLENILNKITEIKQFLTQCENSKENADFSEIIITILFILFMLGSIGFTIRNIHKEIKYKMIGLSKEL